MTITPFEGESFVDFYNRFGESQHPGHWINLNPDSFGAQFSDKLTGDVSTARDIYNTWYNEQSNAKKAQADYEYTRLLNSTKYVDEVKALKDAGLNPYAILSGNGLSAGNMSFASAQAFQRDTPSKKSSGTGAKAIGAIAIIIAALIRAVL